ncbi:SusC/RagA family TonB-linked outer membrane protein [Desertivirga brevis]|uniref:SusC/RagA family TonB-linked outer membrane protein n=1 Tax=Desertivirga brevis TaxID=2810310 RepID=UPI001A97C117|nr:TonB-dependent receptor [Pedobacter sp. SYSU D00873]
MRKAILLLCGLFAVMVTAFAQTRQVTGTVVDKSGEALIGVSVGVKGTSTGVSTDVKGNFKINVPASGSQILVFRYVGFKTKEVAVGDQSQIKVTLQDDVTTLQEVQVTVNVGYGMTSSKEALAGAVSSVGSKELKDNPQNSLGEALAGKLAGVQIAVAEGVPGADVEINVRGRNSITQNGSPLFIVDGVQVENALNTLSPQDIQSIDVLKDAASTAIYGARGSNGVMIITTKGGRNTNGKTTVSYNGFVGLQKLSNQLDMMNPYDFVQFQYERFKITNDSTLITRYIGNTNNYAGVSNYVNTPAFNWQDQMFGRNAFQTTHNASINGGTDKTQYNLSLTHNGEEGLLMNSDYNRNIVNFRFDQKASDKFKVGFNVRYSNQEVNGAGTSDQGGAGSNNLRQIVRFKPFFQPGEGVDFYDAELALETNGAGLSLINPVQLSNAQYRKRTTNVLNINGYGNYSLTKKLSLRSTVGYDINNQDTKAFDDTITNVAKTYGTLPVLGRNVRKIATFNNSNVLSYSNREFLKNKKSSLDAILGQEFYLTNTTNNFLELRYFPAGTTAETAFANNVLAAAPTGYVQPTPTSSSVDIHNLSFFSKVNYSYSGKYIASLTFRADGSSIFAPGKQWGYFPSAQVAWRFSEESFMKNQQVLSSGKIRLTYGTAGNNRIDPYQWTSVYGVGNNYSYYLNGAASPGLVVPSLQNPDLKWETIVSRNLGFDLEFFRGRVNLTADFYNNITKDLLVHNAIPAQNGYDRQFQNVGSTRNKGMEFQLGASVLKKRDFNWNSNFNISFNKNTIRSLGNQQLITWNSGWYSTNNAPSDFVTQVGGQVGTMYGLVNDGFYTIDDFDSKSFSSTNNPWASTEYTLKADVAKAAIQSSIVPGTQKFKDINGDGIINTADYQVIGRALPKFTGGFSNTLNYKNFDMSVFLNFSVGNDVYNFNKLEYSSTYSNGANLTSLMNNRWRTVDPSTGEFLQRTVTEGGASRLIGVSPDQIRAVNANAQYWTPMTDVSWNYAQSFAVEDGSFLRVNNITLGYTLPKSITSKGKISSLRLYVTGNNLATITGYSGYDPEVNSRRNSPLTPSVDYSAYPRARKYVFGVNMTF